jgi:hypothetical protein
MFLPGGIEFRQMQKRLGIAEKLPSTSATRASATTRTLRYPWSTRQDARYIANSFSANKGTVRANLLRPRPCPRAALLRTIFLKSEQY